MSRPRRPEPEKNPSPDRRRRAPIAPIPSHRFLDGEAILDEVRPTTLSLALWQRYRDVALWAAVPLEHRFGLFAAQGSEPLLPVFTLETAGEPDLRPALRTFALLTVHPEATNAETVAAMCVKVSEWAFARGWPRTGLLFAELAHAVRPDDPDNARIAGRACRRCALYERGVQWFRVSLALARRARDAQSAALALIWWGTLEEQRGRLSVTKKLYTQAWKIANRGRLRWIVAQVCHDLMGLELGKSPFHVVLNYAETAAAGYRKGDPRCPAFVIDVASSWICYGYAAEAVPLLKAALPHATDPFSRIMAQSYYARGVAYLGDADRFFSSWNEVEKLAKLRGSGTSTALLNVAHGARALQYEQRALALAEEALKIAREKSETETEEAALQMLSGEPDVMTKAEQEVPEPLRRLAIRLFSLLGINHPAE